jgi:NADH-quinone oxidoreductase subunit E
LRNILRASRRLLSFLCIRVLEVATFYTMFQLSPVGTKVHVQLCGTIACQLRGAEDLRKVCERKIHPQPGHLNTDGSMSWEEVECLGSCVNAPMIQVFKDTYEDLTPAKLEELIDQWQAGKQVKPGPQIDRHYSAPVGGGTTLTDRSLYKGQRSFKRVEAPPPPPPAAAPVPTAPVVVAPLVVAKVAEIPTPKPAAKKAAPKKAAERIIDPPKPAIKSAARAIDGRPELLKKPHGKADDLKLIWGVGPALEKLLNKIGIWHFDQIANWTAKELSWVDEKLEGFKGRAKRDEWVKQSKKLAKGWRPESAVGEKPGKK